MRTIKDEVAAAQAAGDIDTHIWNLGHGVLPTTDAFVFTSLLTISVFNPMLKYVIAIAVAFVVAFIALTITPDTGA